MLFHFFEEKEVAGLWRSETQKMGARESEEAEPCLPDVRKGSESFAQRVTRVDADERIEMLSRCS
jgi:hypothetical protein